jgi:hypothetical protein
MTTPPVMKIRDPMKYPQTEEKSCWKALKYVFCGRDVIVEKETKGKPVPTNLLPKSTELVASPASQDLGDRIKKSEV